jgi:DNA-binding MarR family transcriptional regulator
MEHRDLVRRDANDNDKRVNLIHLTEKGKGLEVRMRIITSRTLKNAFNGIANEDIDTCQKVLRQIFENTQDEASK